MIKREYRKNYDGIQIIRRPEKRKNKDAYLTKRDQKKMTKREI